MVSGAINPSWSIHIAAAEEVDDGDVAIGLDHLGYLFQPVVSKRIVSQDEYLNIDKNDDCLLLWKVLNSHSKSQIMH